MAFVGFSFLQINLPFAASTHERMPEAPNATTLPFEIAGELLGPGCWEADGPVTATAV